MMGLGSGSHDITQFHLSEWQWLPMKKPPHHHWLLQREVSVGFAFSDSEGKGQPGCSAPTTLDGKDSLCHLNWAPSLLCTELGMVWGLSLRLVERTAFRALTGGSS